jgi:type IV secretory pathway VirB4 component
MNNQQTNNQGKNPAPQNQAAVKNNPNSTQNALLVSEIRDGIAIMNDGSFRAIVMCKSINFDLMSPQEREAVEFSYQGFLNSLYFPVQIFIRSQKVDITPYLDKLAKIRSEQDNMLLGLLIEDYVTFLEDIAQQTNIMDKKFYVVIQFPDQNENIKSALRQSKGFFGGLTEMFSPNKAPHVTIDEAQLEAAKTELRNRVQAVMQGLQQCGVQSLPLDTQEIIELFYSSYNPDTATRQQLKDYNELTAPVVTKGAGNAPQPNLDREVTS